MPVGLINLKKYHQYIDNKKARVYCIVKYPRIMMLKL